jgi:hypothetical protein
MEKAQAVVIALGLTVGVWIGFEMYCLILAQIDNLNQYLM